MSLYIMLHNDFEKIPNVDVIIIKFGYNARFLVKRACSIRVYNKVRI